MTSMFFIGMLNILALSPAKRDLCYHGARDGTEPLEAYFRTTRRLRFRRSQ